MPHMRGRLRAALVGGSAQEKAAEIVTRIKRRSIGDLGGERAFRYCPAVPSGAVSRFRGLNLD